MTTAEEIYVRSYLNDIGTTISDAGLTQITESFVVGGSPTSVFTLAHAPSALYTPILLISNDIQLVSYTIVGTTLTLGTAISSVTLQVRYWY